MRAAILGTAGYSGQETLDRVLSHSVLEVVALGSDSLAGSPASALDLRLSRNGAWEQLGVRPDLVTLAKGLGNGLPLGCLLVGDEVAGAFAPGDHASTFGGNPVACAAACAVCAAIDDDFLAAIGGRGEELRAGLDGLGAVREVRGLGLLVGAELDRPAAQVVGNCLERGLLVTSAGERVLRLTPPLTIEPADVAEALDILQEVLA